jgi:hypothetical protein
MTEQQLARLARRRLAILQHAKEVTGNVACTCRYGGISRQRFYTVGWVLFRLGVAIGKPVPTDEAWLGVPLSVLLQRRTPRSTRR